MWLVSLCWIRLIDHGSGNIHYDICLFNKSFKVDWFIGNTAFDHKNLTNIQYLRSVQSRSGYTYIQTMILLSTIYNVNLTLTIFTYILLMG